MLTPPIQGDLPRKRWTAASARLWRVWVLFDLQPVELIEGRSSLSKARSVLMSTLLLSFSVR